MKILVFNCGSSSIKYQLIDMNGESVIAIGLLERIGLEESLLKHEKEGQKFKYSGAVKDHKEGIALIVEKLTSGESKVIDDMNEIDAVGHRVVHAGEEFSGSVLITAEVLDALKRCIPLAPLHNPANILGIEACSDIMPGKPQVGVFDTAFHQTMDPKAYLYAIPYKYYDKYKVRKYGFHGTSHRFVSAEAAEFLGKDIKDLKIVTCHLGNGASIAAVDGGKSIDTSMGFTPLEGLTMGTRSGDIDPAIPFFLMKQEGISPEEMERILNKESGVKGLSEISSDMRDIEDAAFKQNNEMAKTTLDKYHYQIVKYVGAYIAAMNGADAIVFTGGVGENSPETRAEIMKHFTYMNCTIDAEKNNMRGKKADISTDGSTLKALVIPTNEELTIARDTLEIVKSK